MGYLAEFLIWIWMLLFLHAFAWAQLRGGRADMIVVGSTTVPDDDCSRTCLRIIDEGKRPGVNIKNCRKECKEAEDFSSFINETFIDFSQSSDEIVTVQNGSSVLLKCTVVNRNEEPVYWLLKRKHNNRVRNIVGPGGELLDKNNHYEVEGDHYNKSFHLRINKVRPNHAGIYICQVYTTDRDSSIIELEVTLIVNVAASVQGFTPSGTNLPKVYDGPIKKYVYNESDSVELSCDAVGSPKPNVTWRKENDKLSPDEEEEGNVNNPVLQISNIQRSQGGIYTCGANNYGPLPTAERQIEIIVQYAPAVTVKKAEIREPEGEYVTLECYVDALPRAEYRWIKDNRTISADNTVIDERPKSTKVPLLCYDDKIRLIIVSLNGATDYGGYICEATNLLGTASGIIDVSGRPRKPAILSDPTGTRKHSFKLMWTHGANGKPDNPRRIEVSSYVIEYYGWWIQQRGLTQKLVYSQPANDPNTETVSVKPGQYRMSYVLRDLKENVTYNVSLYGRNKYGNGARSTLEFCTATEDYIATTIDTTTYDTDDFMGLRSEDIEDIAKYWQSPKDKNSAARHGPHLLHLTVIVLLYLLCCR